ncbi:MAG: M1 family aminopeptidase [Bacteroidota bacterium]|nr:M1 family aminopeptidase [Bacteroidota bacterium]MDP4234576.1 M1 family aminopeptidase [Bacteroidota bacterium]MDP4243705.1 M1 family aminopeptidase [Bacteroidota bacterium]MDP4288347.1 M1 family aminopeptidase [Bacteroidota bacterium]
MKLSAIIGITLIILAPLHFVRGQSVTYIDTDSTFRVTYVRFELTVRPDTEYLIGKVTLRCVARAMPAGHPMRLSMRSVLSIDTLTAGGVAAAYNHVDDTLYLTPSAAYSPGEVFDVAIAYHGYSYGAYIHTFQDWQPTGIPIIWTASEPFGSKQWWPCKDNPAEKVDSADLLITCDLRYSIASNGTLRAVIDHDTSHTFWWHESYPIDHYLLAFACTEFDTLTHWHRWADGDSTRILNYVFPVSTDTMRTDLLLIDTIIDQYEAWFGPYPFRREKYGTCQWHGGGMENQTLSFCNDADWSLLAHETAHQWFGDGITCKTWNDCWLNEGFATYVTDLFGRRRFGQSWVDTDFSLAEAYVTEVTDGRVHQTDSVFQNAPDDYQRGKRVLDGRLVYAKPGLVLHMLNYVLGSDTAFYRCVREYMMGPLRYGVASTEDFRAAIERASGKDLKWFFDEWIYGDGFPQYSIAWSEQDSLVSVAISQRGSSPNSPFFVMPIELRFTGPGLDTMVQVWNNHPLQSYVFQLSKPASLITFDPHNWLLDGASPRSMLVQSSPNNPARLSVMRESNGTYQFTFNLFGAPNVWLEIYDVMGRSVGFVDGGMMANGTESLQWIPNGLASGVYFGRLTTGSGISTIPFVLAP